MKATPKDMMRGFLAASLVVSFICVCGAFLYSHLAQDKPLDTVGTAALMTLLSYTGIAIGNYLKQGDAVPPSTPPEPK